MIQHKRDGHANAPADGARLVADYTAKVTLLLGVDEGLRYANHEPDIEVLILARDAVIHRSEGFAAYVYAG